MVLQHKYFIRKHYVQVPYAVNANMDLICLSYSLQPFEFKVTVQYGLWAKSMQLSPLKLTRMLIGACL